MKFGSATFLVFIEVAVVVQISERRRIRHSFIEVAHFLAAIHFGTPYQASDAGYSEETRLAHSSGKHPCIVLIAFLTGSRDSNHAAPFFAVARGASFKKFDAQRMCRAPLVPILPPDQAFPPWVDAIANTASRLNDAGF